MCLVESGTEDKELSALDVLSVAHSSPEPLTEVVPGKGILHLAWVIWPWHEAGVAHTSLPGMLGSSNLLCVRDRFSHQDGLMGSGDTVVLKVIAFLFFFS